MDVIRQLRGILKLQGRFAPPMMNKIQIRVDPGDGMLQGRTTPCVRSFGVFVPKRFERSEAVERLKRFERFERLERTDPYDERPHPGRVWNARSAGTVGTDGTVCLR